MLGSSSATRIFLLMRQCEGEAGAAAQLALHPHAPAEMLHDLAADMQAEPAALRLAGQRVARLAKLVEDDPLLRGVDAWTVVAHLHPKGARLSLHGHAALA